MSVLTLTQAKTHLNITVSTYDTELQDFIDAAETAIGKKVGPLTATVTTVKVWGGGPLLLPTTPVISLTSITGSSGAAWDLTGLLVTAEGVVSGVTFPTDLFTVVYSAGRPAVPSDLLMAVKEQVRHMWMTQRGGSKRPGSEESVPVPYMFPDRVTALMVPYMQVP